MIVTTRLLFTLQVLVIISHALPSQLSVPITFRKIGTLASGLAYGHVKFTIDYAGLEHEQTALDRLLHQKILEATTPEERAFFKLLQHQFSVSTRDLARLKHAFFSGQIRTKRQFLGAIAATVGFLGFGLSIYDHADLQRLHSDVTNVKDGLSHIVHTLEIQGQDIQVMKDSIHSITDLIHLVLETVRKDHAQTEYLKGLWVISSMIATFSAQVSALARGLEALLNGNLHPTLIGVNHADSAINAIKDKAAKHGYWVLQRDPTTIFTAPISYITTSDFEIHVYVHIALIDAEPLELFEHLPVPFQHGNLVYRLKSEKDLVASNAIGSLGLEMRNVDLMRCHQHRTHSGNTFLCPDISLMRSNVRQTCLGALLFGDSLGALQHCDNEVFEDSRKNGDIGVQVGPSSFLLYTAKSQTVHENCPNGTRAFRSVPGLSVVRTNPGCTIIGDGFVFKAQSSFEADGEFLERPLELNVTQWLLGTTTDDLEAAFKELATIRDPQRHDLTKLRQWVRRNEDTTWIHLSAGTAFISLTVCIGICVFLAVLYGSYKLKKSRAAQ